MSVWSDEDELSGNDENDEEEEEINMCFKENEWKQDFLFEVYVFFMVKERDVY